MSKRIIKARAVAYKLYKGKQPIPGFLTVVKDRLLPEFDKREHYLAIRVGFGDPVFLSCFHKHKGGKVPKDVLNRFGATKCIRVLLEQEYVKYK